MADHSGAAAGRRAHAARAGGRGGGPGLRLGRELRPADLRDRAATQRLARVRGQARRDDPGGPQWDEARHAVPRHLERDRHRRRAWPALDDLRARLRDLRAGLRLHGRPPAAGRDPDPRVQALGRERRPHRPDRADRVPGDAQRGVQPQRRPGRGRAGRLPVVRDRRRRRGRRRPQPRTRPLEPTRQGAADRPAARQRGELRNPGEQPVRQRDLGLRPAQPVPLLVRPRVGRPLDRGRRPGRARGDRPRDGERRAGARRRLRLGVQEGTVPGPRPARSARPTSRRSSTTTARPARTR